MSVKTNIKDFYGRVIGSVVEENNGDKTIKDFYGRPLGYYKNCLLYTSPSPRD